jgi:glycosyltransferase involved in cell wall biosynthesis
MVDLTIGMATYNDYDGVYFTLQALKLYHDLEGIELVVVDNYGCAHTEALVRDWVKGRYVRAVDAVGTAAPRNVVFEEARGKAVVCCDCHVLFAPGSISRLREYYHKNPSSGDLLQGPLIYDDGRLVATHFEPEWRDQMWGTWATDSRGINPDSPPFEIPMQGLGVFSCRRDAWLGFNSAFRGFGGEEGYIHEKFRQNGRRCLCLPWFRWMHRFGRPAGVPFPLRVEDRIRNYVIGHAELSLDLAPIVEHFQQYVPTALIAAIVEETVGMALMKP